MLLKDKHAVIFAATGAVASEVARTFAREGAHVWLSGRNEAKLSELVDEIQQQGGNAHFHLLDATNPQAVGHYVAHIAKEIPSLDITFNGIGLPPKDLGYPALSAVQPLEDFFKPINLIVGSTFLTSREVAKVMQGQGHGSIITLSATLNVMPAAFMAGISAACGAVESITRSLAGEFGPSGIRVNCVRGNAMPETATIQLTTAGLEAILGRMPEPSPPPLGRPITVAETAKTAAYLASDLASGVTGQVVMVSAGAFV
ncbi:MAG: SDR family oxidoreductase [Trueperaceae bacterium]|nr:SDR family oxidoreductase [Trueperaceae bacterium]